MTIREIYIKHKRPIIIGVVIIALAFVAWFVLRHIEDIKADSKAERDLLLRQRVEAIRALRERDSIALAKEDSLLREIYGIKTRVEYKIIEREKWITKFIDTASIRSKHNYLDSLFGPK